ncbi:expressed unknown protein [Seminavis robusta]|uniref:Uncharacterized protein n=1 Tax=Seminavis robusta TaxID=568900 RepID=A0A9N8HGH6_9STRA|nr:expressed unknown protein [Seminavis robusta]|eukprot:Sro509_g157050.1 n/a (448) ;mRNA; f:30170-31513
MWDAFCEVVAPTPKKPITSKFQAANCSPPEGHADVFVDAARAANLGIDSSTLSTLDDATITYMFMKDFDKTLLETSKEPLTKKECGELLVDKARKCIKLHNIVAVKGGDRSFSVLPEKLHTYKQFLEDHPTWKSGSNNNARTIFTTNEGLQPIYRVQKTGLCTWTSATSVKDYDHQIKFRSLYGECHYTNISRFIRNHLDKRSLCELIFPEHFPNDVSLPRSLNNLKCLYNQKTRFWTWTFTPFMKSSIGDSLRDASQAFIATSPGLVSNFLVDEVFMNSDRTSFEGPVTIQDDKIVGVHSLILVGVRTDEKTKKVWYMLQNSWMEKQFVEVDFSYLASIATVSRNHELGGLMITFPEPCAENHDELPTANSGFHRGTRYIESSPRHSFSGDEADSDRQGIAAVVTGDAYEIPELVSFQTSSSSQSEFSDEYYTITISKDWCGVIMN